MSVKPGAGHSSNASYAFVPSASSTSYQKNGLNQYTEIGGATAASDARGNLTGDGVRTYEYDVFDRLTSVSAGPTLIYDPLDRLAQTTTGAATTRFLSDGGDVVAEFDGSGALLRRYVVGPDGNEPLVWYEGSGTADRRFLAADERGSIITATNGAGAALTINSYDEYGLPGTGNGGRHAYTGQIWLAEAGLYHLRSRAYAPSVGRFLQTDPVGFFGGLNLYSYVSNDPLNLVDPNGTAPCSDTLCVSPPKCSAQASSCLIPGEWVDSYGTILAISSEVTVTARRTTCVECSTLLGEFPPLSLTTSLSVPFNAEIARCVAANSDVGGFVGAAVAGAALIGSSSRVLPYSLFGKPLSGGTGGTSVVSALARGFIGPGLKFEPKHVDANSGSGWLALKKITGTGSKAAIVGRLASRSFVLLGVGLEAYAAYEVLQVYGQCATR